MVLFKIRFFYIDDSVSETDMIKYVCSTSADGNIYMHFRRKKEKKKVKF